jgi:hypothetical protein
MKLKKKKKQSLEIIEEQANKEMHLLQEVGVRSPDFNNKKLTKPNTSTILQGLEDRTKT